MATHSCSCLENPRDGGAWWAAVYGVAQSRTRLKQLSSSREKYGRQHNMLRLFIPHHLNARFGFPGGSAGKESACNAGDPGLIPGSGRSLGEGNGNPLQYSCLGNPMDRGAWQATVHGSQKSQTQLSNLTAVIQRFG